MGGLLQGPGIGYIATPMLPPCLFSGAGSDILDDIVCGGLLGLVVLLGVSLLILEADMVPTPTSLWQEAQPSQGL